MTFYLSADKNSIVSSYFIVEKGFFVGIYKKKGLGPDRTPSAHTSPPDSP